MVTLNNRYSGLITKGLGLPACSGLIVNLFGVTNCLEIIPIRTSGGSAGGSIPLMPGEITGLYQPVDGKLVDPRVYGKHHVKITIKFKKETFQKEFMVSERKSKIIIKIINIINTTKSRAKITVNNIKKITNRIMINIINFSKK